MELSRCSPQTTARERGDSTHPFTVQVSDPSPAACSRGVPKASFISAPLNGSRAVHPQRPGSSTFGEANRLHVAHLVQRMPELGYSARNAISDDWIGYSIGRAVNDE